MFYSEFTFTNKLYWFEEKKPENNVKYDFYPTSLLFSAFLF